MDKDRIKGAVKQAGGALKTGVGKVTGNTELEVEGKVEQAEGKVQSAYGKAKDSLRKL